jgi:hypothetical protein
MAFKNIYIISKDNWYRNAPYGFIIHSNSGVQVYYLPISPQNIQVSTPFNTNLIPTMGGTVEEHTELRYYDIAIEGTTGMMPKSYPTTVDLMSNVTPQQGRTSFSVQENLIEDNTGLFSKTISVINKIASSYRELTSNKEVDTIGTNNSLTGYAAFHNLYTALMSYKNAIQYKGFKPTNSEDHPIIFFNMKDGVQYDVVIKSFNMRRSAENPMLYFYSIQMRGYNLRSSKIDTKGAAMSDKLASLGLSGISSSTKLGEVKNTASKIKSIIGAVGGGIKIFSR